MLDLFTLLVFAVVLVAALAVFSISGRRRRDEAAAERLKSLEALVTEEAGTLNPLSTLDVSVMLGADDYDGPLPSLHRRSRAFFRRLEMLGWTKNLRWRAAALAGGALFAGLLAGRMTDHPFWVTLGVGTLIAAAVFTILYLKAMGEYIEGLAKALPETIDSIARICRAGIPAQTAFGLAAQSVRGPLADELLAMDRWLKLGVPLKQVLQESARRVPLAEYRFFAVILIISQESGGRLADTLERLAKTLRDRAELQLKVEAKTSEARASIKIVACLVPGVLAYMYWQTPEDFHFLLTDPVGLKVMGYAAVSVAFGLFVTWLMVKRIQ